MRRVLITGGAGRIGQSLRERLSPDYALRLLDIADADGGPGVEVVRADLTDREAVEAACDGVDAVIHLGGIPTEAAWEDLVRVNIDGSRTVLEAARATGVPRVVLASSVHAAGFYPRTATPLGADTPGRPDTYYGWSKAAIESLGSLYADRFGMTVFAIRIGAFQPAPYTDADVPIWLAPDDCARLMRACLETAVTGFRVLWGVSANSTGWLALDDAVGYVPLDDSVRFADQATPSDAETMNRLGGVFCRKPLGQPDR